MLNRREAAFSFVTQFDYEHQIRLPIRERLHFRFAYTRSEVMNKV